MTTTTDQQLARAQAAAEAATPLLPASAPLVAGAATAGVDAGALVGQAVCAGFTGSAQGEVVIVVGQDRGVGGLGVGLEIVDVGREPRGLEESVTGNVLHRAFALGPVGPLGAEATMTVNGEVRHRAPVTGDPTAVLASVDRWLRAAGECLEPGDVVFAGSLNHVPVEPGDRVEAAISGLGSVGARIA
jgi:hypothetical protein